MSSTPASPLASPGIRKAVGIDLGTTNSVIALLDPTDSVLLTGQDEAGRRTFPSVVAYRESSDGGEGGGRVVVGRPAASLPDRAKAVASVKRFMGLGRTFPVGPEQLTPPQVSARILTHLRDVMARTLNDTRYLLDAAIVTMPAYFNHNQIEATRQAGELAGFEVIELLHEPTAAAIYYSWACDHDDAGYLVYDLGGGTFDVSVIRKQWGDYEVLSVSGDPFLGGDDFDRLLASHLQSLLGDRGKRVNFDLAVAEGAANFARLVHLAERVKVELSEREVVSRSVPDLLRDADGLPVPVEFEVDRATFHRLIRDKVERTIECCHEALHRARAKADLTLSGIDHVILVGGSSRIPLVRETVRAAFCNPDLPEHTRSTEPLLHEPDLCVAYGAALRAASYGTRYLLKAHGVHPVGFELHVTSPPTTRDQRHTLTGIVRGPAELCDGASVRVEALATGMVEEAFLDGQGTFAQEVNLVPETDNAFRLTVCDAPGRELAAVTVAVRHTRQGRRLGQAVMPTQLITKPLQIEVLNRARQRVRQVIAPVGATLPGSFRCTCRTVDQAGRIVVPVYEENRVIKQLVIDNLDRELPVDTAVEIELEIDVKHTLRVKVAVPLAGRAETISIEAAPPPKPPTRAEIDQVRRQVEALLGEFSGSYRTRMKAQLARLVQDLDEAMRYEDEPKAIQRMAELRDLVGQMETARTQILEPPWPRFAQLVKHCLMQAGAVADRTGRNREELFEQVYAQERYAEQAYEDRNQTLYRECFENLNKFAAYLDQLQRERLPGSGELPRRPPTPQDAVQEVREFGYAFDDLRKKASRRGRADLVAKLDRLAEGAKGLPEKAKQDVHGCFREIQRLRTELTKVEEEFVGRRLTPPRDDEGMLEGSS